MALSTLMERAYAANLHSGVIIDAIEIDHAAFTGGPAYLATGFGADVALPLVLGGTPVMFKDIAFVLIPPGHNESGPTPPKLSIRDRDGYLQPHLDAATTATDPPTLVWRRYFTTDLTAPGEVYSGLFMTEAHQKAAGVEAVVTFREIATQAFPLKTYDALFYPTLQSQF